jgi:hypothetical protein
MLKPTTINYTIAVNSDRAAACLLQVGVRPDYVNLASETTTSVPGRRCENNIACGEK